MNGLRKHLQLTLSVILRNAEQLYPHKESVIKLTDRFCSGLSPGDTSAATLTGAKQEVFPMTLTFSRLERRSDCNDDGEGGEAL